MRATTLRSLPATRAGTCKVSGAIPPPPMMTLGASAGIGRSDPRRRPVRGMAPRHAASCVLAWLRKIVGNGEMFQIDKRNVAGFPDFEGVLWRAIMKRARDGSETCLGSPYKAHGNSLRAAGSSMEAVER